MAKRISTTLSDSAHEELHNGKFGKYEAHRFTNEYKLYDDHQDLTIGKNIWEKLGKPDKVRVTISVVE